MSHPPPPPPPPPPSHDPGPPPPPPVLAEILDHTRGLVDAARSAGSWSELEARARDEEPARDLVGAVMSDAAAGARPGVIAEIKRRSPSAGWIREEYRSDGFGPEDIAQGYLRGGASAISCLTDEKFFGGSLGFIRRIRDVVALPVLRKDFLIDPWQVLEARAAGADAVLLIAEALGDGAISEILDLSADLGMGVLLEAHDERNVSRCRRLLEGRERALLGINNRDLRSMTTDSERTIRLLDQAGDPARVVAESGLHRPGDLQRLAEAGVGGALIGESLMRSDDPGAALSALLGGGGNPGVAPGG